MGNGASGLLNAFRQGSPEAFDAAFETLFHQHQRVSKAASKASGLP